MILQKILQNRIFFMACLAVIWTMTFLMPHIGNYVKTKRTESNFQIELERRMKKRNPVYELKKEEWSINHLHSGWFHQDKMCLDSLDSVEDGNPGMWKCHDEGKNQFWFIMKDSNALRNRQFCLQGPKELGVPGNVTMQKCDPTNENQAWVYEEEALKLSGGELCLDSLIKIKKVKLSVCDSEKASQRWKLKTLSRQKYFCQQHLPAKANGAKGFKV